MTYMYIFNSMQYLQINKQSISERAILSANNFFKCLHPIQQQNTLISVEFHGLNCSKSRNSCFSKSRSRPQISFWRLEDKKKWEGRGEGKGKGEEETRSGKIRIETSADWLFIMHAKAPRACLFLLLAVLKTCQRRFIELKRK